MNHRVGLLVLLSLSVVVIAVPTAAADSQAGTISLEQELVLTPEPGEIEVVLRFGIPDAVTELSTRVPEGATVTKAAGFEGANGKYEWTGTTGSPTLSYVVSANRPYDGGGGLMFVDAGEWALIERPKTAVRWRWIGGERVALDRTTRTDSGVAGERSAFLGDHAIDARAAGGETITLVIPAASSPAESPDAVHAALEDATDLRVGGRNDRMFVVVAPSDERWALRGLQFGSSDAWVREDSRLDDPDNVWVHEYVHSRQKFETDEEVRWFREGSAAYYAALLTYERGDVGFETFHDRLARGERSPHADDVLADPATWTRGPNYHKGALVAADLDRRIRLATDGERDLQDVFRAMNEHEDRVTQAAFLEFVEEAGGPEVREVARTYTETRDGPAMWNERTHHEAFDLTAPRMEYRLADDPAAYRVSGPYRERPLDELVLVPGERLETTAAAENVGDAPGEYAATVAVDERRPVGNDRTGLGGATVERIAEGRLDPGERDEITVAHAFEEPGTYVLSVDGASVEVRVVEPAEPTVTAVESDSTAVAPGETVTLVATVENDAAVPGRADLELVGDGIRENERVRLDAGETATVEFTTRLESPGEHELRVGGRSTTVRVEPAVASSLPGFGVPVAIAAFVLLVFSAAPRRSRVRR